MSGKIDLPKITLHYDGIFDFDGLYAAVSDWAKNYGYMWHEKDYKHKVPTARGAEEELQWNIDKKVVDGIHYNIFFHLHLWEVNQIKVEGKDLTKAKIAIVINGTLTYDWQNIFTGSRFAKKLGTWYGKLFMRDLETKFLDPLYYRMWNLHAVIRKYFDMQAKKYAYKGYLGES